MIRRVGIVLAVVVVALVAFVATQPDTFRIAHSTSVTAPASKVFRLVNDLHEFQTWNPYAKKDPAMVQTWEGPVSGIGALYRWAGNNDIGAGSMKIVESRLDERVGLELEFSRPFKAMNDVVFTFEPKGEQTVVTWAMTGKNNFVAKAMQLMMNMDQMVGGDFEKGLADLKALAEKT